MLLFRYSFYRWISFSFLVSSKQNETKELKLFICDNNFVDFKEPLALCVLVWLIPVVCVQTARLVPGVESLHSVPANRRLLPGSRARGCSAAHEHAR